MKIIPAAQLPPLTPSATLYKLGQFGSAFGLCFFIAMLGGSVWLLWQCWRAASYGWMIPLFFYLLLSYFLCNIAWYQLKALRSSRNWLLRIDSDGLYINFRSYLQQALSEQDPTALQLYWHEITQAQLQRETHIQHDANHKTVSNRWFVEVQLKLSDTQLEQIQTALQNERQRKPAHFEINDIQHQLFLARKHKKSAAEIEHLKQALQLAKQKHPGKHSKARYNHFPVTWQAPNVLRLEWTHVTPGKKHLRRELQRHVIVEHAAEQHYDFDQPMSEAEFEQFLDTFIQRGETMQAIKLVRAQKNLGLTEAKQWVEQRIKREKY